MRILALSIAGLLVCSPAMADLGKGSINDCPLTTNGLDNQGTVDDLPAGTTCDVQLLARLDPLQQPVNITCTKPDGTVVKSSRCNLSVSSTAGKKCGCIQDTDKFNECMKGEIEQSCGAAAKGKGITCDVKPPKPGTPVVTPPPPIKKTPIIKRKPRGKGFSYQNTVDDGNIVAYGIYDYATEYDETESNVAESPALEKGALSEENEVTTYSDEVCAEEY